jgi:hypothetical protein
MHGKCRTLRGSRTNPVRIAEGSQVRDFAPAAAHARPDGVDSKIRSIEIMSQIHHRQASSVGGEATSPGSTPRSRKSGIRSEEFCISYGFARAACSLCAVTFRGLAPLPKPHPTARDGSHTSDGGAMRRRIAAWLGVTLALCCGCSSPPPATRPLEGAPPPSQRELHDRWLRNRIRASM